MHFHNSYIQYYTLITNELKRHDYHKYIKMDILKLACDGCSVLKRGVILGALVLQRLLVPHVTGEVKSGDLRGSRWLASGIHNYLS